MKTTIPVKVYYEDTDAGGVVYYANYLKYAERGRTEFFNALGFTNSHFLKAETPCAFMVRRAEIDYKKPARLEDDLTVETEATEVKGAAMTFSQKVMKGAEELVVMNIQVVCASLQGRPLRIPSAITVKLQTGHCERSEAIR